MLLNFCFFFLYTSQVSARPDFLDAMSHQFFGLPSDDNGQSQQQKHQPSSDPFAQMFGSAAQQAPQRTPPRNIQNPNHHQRNPPHRQGYYPPPHTIQQQVHLPYSGPPPVYGQQQGFGQRQPNSNETKTEGYPSDNSKSHHLHQHPHQRHPYPPEEYHHHHHQHPATVVEYQSQYPQHHPQQVEYHHIPQHPVVAQEHHPPTLEIHTGTEHAYHEPPTHVEYHHPPEVVEYHHHTTPKPKRFHLSFSQNPEYKIIDKHLKLPPVKFRFHINPKIVITTNTKDPLDKKHHDDEHDLEPFPPPDVFSDHNAPPSINDHKVEVYPLNHHYPVEHHAVKHYVADYPEAKHPYPVEHHVINHHPGQEYTYDLSHGHSHLNPHRSLGHYEPTFKIKTKPIIFTEPPPTRPTTTTRRTTTTIRTTTARTTARTTTTSRPTRRARISARNPGFSVAFTQDSTSANTTEASTTSTTTTRRSVSRNNSERERENGGISARKDELSTSEIPQTTRITTTTPRTTSATTTTTTTTAKPTSTTPTTPQPMTTATSRTTIASITTQRSATFQNPTSSTTTTSALPVSQPTRFNPVEETTPRTTTLNIDANEIDLRKTTESPRRRPEPLLGESSSVERSGSYNLENSESVKVIETTMLIDGKNQTVRFYYITEPVKLPLHVFQKMTGQSKDNPSGVNVIKIRDKRYAVLNQELDTLHHL